jgi:hypothetical protein
MFRKAICGIALTACAGMSSVCIRAQQGADEAFDERSRQDCVVLRRIGTTSVIDDRTVLFYMRGGEIYENRLDRACPRLGRAGRFSYSVATGRLCSNDMITVFDPFDPAPGVTCGLGDFRPILAEEAERLEQGPDPAEEEIEIETIDVPVEDADGGAAEAGASDRDEDAEPR